MHKKIVLFYVLLSFISSAFAASEPFIFDVKLGQKDELPDSRYLVLNHSSSWWDRTESTKDATGQLIQNLSTQSLKSIALISPSAAYKESDHSSDSYYFSNQEVDIKVASDSGMHRLLFPNVSSLLFAGGNFTSCLCEAIRDSIRGADINQERLKIILLTDAIYDNSSRYEKYQKSLVSKEKTWLSLADLISTISDKMLIKLLRKEILGDMIQFCPHQTDRYLSPLKYRFVIRRDGREIGRLGLIGKVIEIDFSTITQSFPDN